MRSSTTRPPVGLLALVLVISFPSCKAFREGMAQSTTARKVASACEGTGVDGSAPYLPGTGKAPISAARIRDKGGYEAGGNVIPFDTEQPVSLEAAQLVLCIDAPQEVDLGACVYDTVSKVAFVEVPGTRRDGPTFARTRSDQPVRVVEAATGKVLVSETLAGDEPPACDAALIGGPDQAYFRGGAVGEYTMGQWAKKFVTEH